MADCVPTINFVFKLVVRSTFVPSQRAQTGMYVISLSQFSAFYDHSVVVLVCKF